MRTVDRPSPAPFAALVLLVALPGCVNPTPGEAVRRADTQPGVVQPVSDRKIRQRLEREGAELLAGGATVPMSTLRGQLARTHCALRLPPPARRRAHAPVGRHRRLPLPVFPLHPMARASRLRFLSHRKMVFKNCTPASALLPLLRARAARP